MTDSLIGALNKARIASENHGFIRWITECVGATGYVVNDTVDKPHVIATWANGARKLHIYYGYTTGFASKEEIIELLGNRAEPQRSKAGWWVPHPENRIYDGSERAKNKGREAGFCGLWDATVINRRVFVLRLRQQRVMAVLLGQRIHPIANNLKRIIHEPRR